MDWAVSRVLSVAPPTGGWAGGPAPWRAHSLRPGETLIAAPPRLAAAGPSPGAATALSRGRASAARGRPAPRAPGAAIALALLDLRGHPAGIERPGGAQDPRRRELADPLGDDRALEIRDTRDRQAVALEQQVLGPHARPPGGTVVGDFGDLDRVAAAFAEAGGWREGPGAARDPEVGAAHAAVGHWGAGDRQGDGPDGDREARADGGRGATEARYDPQVVHERTAAVAWVERRGGRGDLVGEASGVADAGSS